MGLLGTEPENLFQDFNLRKIKSSMFAATYNCDPDKADENRQRPARTAMSHSPKKASDVGSTKLFYSHTCISISINDSVCLPNMSGVW